MADLADKPAKIGDRATEREILDLAGSYREAALLILRNGERASSLRYDPLHFEPARFCALHALELCQNAFLRHEGWSNDRIKALRHELSEADFIDKLALKKKTAEHLRRLAEPREYLISRYGPDLCRDQTEFSALISTLDHVLNEVYRHLWGKTA